MITNNNSNSNNNNNEDEQKKKRITNERFFAIYLRGPSLARARSPFCVPLGPRVATSRPAQSSPALVVAAHFSHLYRTRLAMEAGERALKPANLYELRSSNVLSLPLARSRASLRQADRQRTTQTNE